MVITHLHHLRAVVDTTVMRLHRAAVAITEPPLLPAVVDITIQQVLRVADMAGRHQVLPADTTTDRLISGQVAGVSKGADKVLGVVGLFFPNIKKTRAIARHTV